MAWMWVRQYLLRYRRAAFITLIVLVLLFYNRVGLLVSSPLDSIKLYENLERETNDELQKCQIPFYHPFEPDVITFFKSSTPLRCRASVPMLTYVDTQGFLRYNTTALEKAGYSQDSLVCTYQNIWKVSDDNKIVYSEKRPVTGMDKPESDFFRVACLTTNRKRKTYKMYHATVQKDPQVREFEDDEEVGVAVVGLDSVSRLNFMRQLPRSYLALTRILGAVVFKGFNKVGFNTFPNLVPILMGSPAGNTSDSTTFDDWPFLWKPLKADGVATFYGEDTPRVSTFSYWGSGFQVSPTHHYFRRYWVAVEHSDLNTISSKWCLGPVPKHRIYLDYLLSFFRAYKTSPQFMFSLENEPSHDYVNAVGVIDKDLESFLLTGHAEGLFNRTILFVLADHGNRMDDFRQTGLGKLEDFMPMVSMVVPPWLARKHPHLISNLATNAKRLTSSYDLFSTFTDIFNRQSFRKEPLKKYNFQRPTYGQSLFQPIPLSRTCSDAGIPEMFCICKEGSQTLDNNDLLVQKSTEIILNYMNDQVLNGSSLLWQSAMKQYLKARIAGEKPNILDTNVITEKCSRLSLSTVETAELFVKPDRRKIVYIKYRTSPNDGLYEGRVQWDLKGLGTLHEELNRSNRYGDQSNCLNRELFLIVPFVRSACFCY